jgi:hypothetical protein
MRATILTWTRLERPPAGFAPGRVVVLAETEQGRVYARWTHDILPSIGAQVDLRRGPAGWDVVH